MLMYLSEPIFEAFRDLSPSELPKVLKFPLDIFSYRKPKGLSSNMLKDIGAVNEPRLLVLTGHLYLDYILGKMVDREPNTLTQRQKESFYAKLDFLNNLGKFDRQTYLCLSAVNKLRNSFAHDIFYDIVKWDPNTIPYVQHYKLRIPKRKGLLRAFNIMLLKISFFALVEVLFQQYRWLYLENVPKA